MVDHNIKAASLIDIETLISGLPGDVKYHLTSNARQKAEVAIFAYDSSTNTRKYDFRFRFDLANHIASIENFSIHNPRERGQGLGAKAVANLLDASTRADPPVTRIPLTAELERGAFVWAKLGWLPNANSFSRLQKKCQPKLDILQQLLPEPARLETTTYGIFRELLDAAATKDPEYIWPIVDSKASYPLNALKRLQDLSRINDHSARQSRLSEIAAANGLQLQEPEKADKTLHFIRDLDLEGLSKDGKVCVSVLLFSWEQWKGDLDLGNQKQVERLEAHLAPVRQTKSASRPNPHKTPSCPLVKRIHG